MNDTDDPGTEHQLSNWDKQYGCVYGEANEDDHQSFAE